MVRARGHYRAFGPGILPGLVDCGHGVLIHWWGLHRVDLGHLVEVGGVVQWALSGCRVRQDHGTGRCGSRRGRCRVWF